MVNLEGTIDPTNSIFSIAYRRFLSDIAKTRQIWPILVQNGPYLMEHNCSRAKKTIKKNEIQYMQIKSENRARGD